MPTPLFYYRRNRSFAAFPVRICGIAFGAVLAATRLRLPLYRRNHGFAALPVRICGIAFGAVLAATRLRLPLYRRNHGFAALPVRICGIAFGAVLAATRLWLPLYRRNHGFAALPVRICGIAFGAVLAATRLRLPFIAGITASLRFRYASAESPSALSSLLLAFGSLLSPESPSALFVRTCCVFGLRGAELPSRRRLNLCPSIARHYRRNLRLPVFLPSSIIILNVTASSKLRRSSPMARCTFSKR